MPIDRVARVGLPAEYNSHYLEARGRSLGLANRRDFYTSPVSMGNGPTPFHWGRKVQCPIDTGVPHETAPE